MKKIIIILMGITMMLVSCSTPSTINDDEDTYEEPSPKPIEPVETDVDYFMLEDGEDITDFEYKVMYNDDVECTIKEYAFPYRIDFIFNHTIVYLYININNNEVKFSLKTKTSLKVHNVTRNGNTVTIEIVDL